MPWLVRAAPNSFNPSSERIAARPGPSECGQPHPGHHRVEVAGRQYRNEQEQPTDLGAELSGSQIDRPHVRRRGSADPDSGRTLLVGPPRQPGETLLGQDGQIAGTVGNQVTSVIVVPPPGGASCTQRWPGPIGSSATSVTPSVST
jgi:hypothetical protein